MKNFKSIACTSAFLMSLNSAFADEIAYDKSIAEGAAKQAAEKLGEIRLSINYDQKPAIVDNETEVLNKQIEEETSENQVQRITDEQKKIINPNEQHKFTDTELDYRPTGSIQKTVRKTKVTVTWQKFDIDGNLVD